MDIVFLNEAEHLDCESEFMYTDITSIQNCYNKLHTHDYYEILLVVEGAFNHYVNSTRTVQKEGSLIFFRPKDIHRIEPYGNQECHLINVTYRKKTLLDLLVYVGKGFDPENFMNAPLPPCVVLNSIQKQELLGKLDRLNTIPITNKKLMCTTFRFILFELFYEHLVLQPKANQADRPDWLVRLCDEMQYRENFIKGTGALVAISGKSHAYLCRCFKNTFKLPLPILLTESG